MAKILGLFILVILSACIPKAEEIAGCKDGTSFSDVSLTCVTAAPAISYGGSLTSLNLSEDVPLAFNFPMVSTLDVPGSLYYFVVTPPIYGAITDCADRDGSGNQTVEGTTDRACSYVPRANYFGLDSFTYRVCNTLDGSARCGATFTVTVTVNAVNDLPVLIAPAVSNVLEGATIAFEIKAGARGPDEDDDIYVRFTPDAALLLATTGSKGVDLTPPSIGDFAAGACHLIANEVGPLTSSVARFVATANTLGCPLDDCFDGGSLQIELFEDAGCAGPSVSTTVNVTISPRNFAPTFASTAPYELVPANTINEGPTVYTIGTGAQTYALPAATDADLEPFTYHYVVGSLNPTTSGDLVCTDGATLDCTFTPNPEYAGPIIFRYYAKDGKTPAGVSTQKTVNWVVTGINDPPVFKGTSQVFAMTVTPTSLVENTTISRTLLVGEGGGPDENVQTLTLSASSDNNPVLAPANISVLRNGTLLGTLATPVVLANGSLDADGANYTLQISPPANLITNSDAVITLTLDDGLVTSNINFTIDAITNVDNPPVFTTPPPGSLGLQQAVPKTITFMATPGTGDWVNVASASQSLVVTIESSSPSVVPASNVILTFPIGVGTVSAGACGTASCSYTIGYNGSNDPADDLVSLQVNPGTRGSTNLRVTLSDGVNTAVRNISTSVYNFAVAFNGWSHFKAEGLTTYSDKHLARAADPIKLTVGWNPLTVTEGGTPSSAYTVRIYRRGSDVYTALSGNALLNAGTSASNSFEVFTDSATPFDDGTTFTSGEDFYLILAIVPIPLGDVMTPAQNGDTFLQVVVPPDNMVLVHPWMANKEFCEGSGQTPDRANGYRCVNRGLGAYETTPTNFHYDLKEFVFMDKFEAGCPYDVTNDGPTALVAASNPGIIHYNRLDQSCTVASGPIWVPYNTNAANVELNRGQMPPLVMVDADEAQNMCQNQDLVCDQNTCPGLLGGADRNLPTRREAIAAAVWPLQSPSSDTLVTIEDSGDHSKFACNTNAALGLTALDLATVNRVADVFPFSLSAPTRNLTNSANASKFCESRYGVRNIVGNVKEHLADQFGCTAGVAPNVSCTISTPLGVVDADLNDADPLNNSLGLTYAFNGVNGSAPYLQSGSTTLTAFSTFMLTTFDMFHRAVGLPYKDNGATPVSGGILRYAALTSAPTVINNNQLGNDGIGLLFDTNGADYGGTQGGDSTDLNRAGRWTFQVRRNTLKDAKTGFRCVVRISP